MAKGRRLKSAYRLTTRRKAALRKAQLISARKRKGRGKGALAAVGVLAVTGGAIIGYKYKGSGIQADLKSRDFSMTNTRNNLAGRLTTGWKERNMVDNAVSPASAARQAAPVKPPKINNSTPRPNTNTSGVSPSTANWGNIGGETTTQVPSQGAVTDPFAVAQLEKAKDPNSRTIHPMAVGMTKERISEGLTKAGVKSGEATWREIAVLAEVQAEYLNRTKNAGFKVYGPGRGNKSYNMYYRSLLDIMEIPSAGDLKRAAQKK